MVGSANQCISLESCFSGAGVRDEVSMAGAELSNSRAANLISPSDLLIVYVELPAPHPGENVEDVARGGDESAVQPHQQTALPQRINNHRVVHLRQYTMNKLAGLVVMGNINGRDEVTRISLNSYSQGEVAYPLNNTLKSCM